MKEEVLLCCMDVSRGRRRGMSDFANTRSVVVGHFSMYTFNLNLDVLCRVGWGGIDCSPGFFSVFGGFGRCGVGVWGGSGVFVFV